MAETRPTASAITRAACLLLAPAGCDVPGDLLDGLRSRGVVLREVTDAPAVMAELADGLHRIVILVEPGAIRDIDALVSAIRRYHPKTSLWRYSMALSPALQAYPGGGEPQAEALEKPKAEPAEDEPIHDEPVAEIEVDEPAITMAVRPTLAQPESEQEETDDGPLLTEEELAMLLGDDESEGTL